MAIDSQPSERNPESVYLDSNFYLDYLQGDRPYHDALKAVLDAWQIGEVQVATSALTLTEVLYVKRPNVEERVVMNRSREGDIIDLFRQYGSRHFRLIELDRTIGEAARELFWEKGIQPKDAVHIASALRARIPVLFTSDGQLVSLSEQVGGQPLLRIERPHWVIQTGLDDALKQHDE